MSEEQAQGFPVPDDEAERLDALDRYGILDTAPDQAYDDLTRLAARACGTEYAALNFIGEDRQWVKASYGGEGHNCPRAQSFCAHAICMDKVLVVPDTRKDHRFSGSPFVTGDDGLRFYAGAPVRSPDGHAVGTVCVFDTSPGQLNPEEQRSLEALSRQVSLLLELRRIGRAWRQASSSDTSESI